MHTTLKRTTLKDQWYLAGPEATQIVLDHEAQVQAVSEAILTATGLKNTPHGEIVIGFGGRFHGYRPTTTRLLPGFRMSRTAGDSGIAVLALRTTTGKLIRDQLAKVPTMPEPEDLTKALCGEPWCALQVSGRNMQAATFGVERVGGRLYIVGIAGGFAPRGCTAVADPRVVDENTVVH